MIDDEMVLGGLHPQQHLQGDHLHLYAILQSLLLHHSYHCNRIHYWSQNPQGQKSNPQDYDKKIFISATFNTEFYSTKYLLVSVFSPTEHIILFTYNLHYPSCLKIIMGDHKYLKGQKNNNKQYKKTEEKYSITTIRTFLASIIIIKFSI